jgi:chromosome segregation ATPase
MDGEDPYENNPPSPGSPESKARKRRPWTGNAAEDAVVMLETVLKKLDKVEHHVFKLRSEVNELRSDLGSLRTQGADSAVRITDLSSDIRKMERVMTGQLTAMGKQVTFMSQGLTLSTTKHAGINIAKK